jgi:hypothetical protein
VSTLPAILKPADFEALGAPLTVEVDGVSIELAVKAVKALPPHQYREEPFSLTLVGPRAPALAQGMYALGHPRLGLVEIFLVPVAQDADSTRYDATFN